jgi:hypothetical protein
MFDWFLPIDNASAAPAPSGPDAIDLLKNDHDSVKELFALFKQAADRRAKTKIAKQTLAELKLHTVLEEEIFYPAVRQHVGKDVMNEADEEHHVANVLIAELENMDGRGDHYDAKFNVLAENVLHHIREEESDMLPKAQDMNIDFGELGREMLRRKEQLLAGTVARKKPHRAAKRARA